MSKPWTAILLFLASAAAAGTVRVDFGTETSPVRPGFLRVTHKTVFSEGTPAGWLKADGLVSRDNPVPRDWKPDPSRGRDNPPPIYTTDLRQDCVQGSGAATLALRVPDGAYRVWLLCGSAGGSRSQVWDTSLSFGTLKLAPDAPLPAAIALDFSLEAATFAGPHACRALVGHSTAKDGRIEVCPDTRSRWVVNAMLVVPEAEWEKVKPLVRRGRPLGSGTKAQVTLRLDVEVLEKFKASGDGWQTRINEALKSWVQTHA